MVSSYAFKIFKKKIKFNDVIYCLLNSNIIFRKLPYHFDQNLTL